jgi:hypothetical protein
MNQEDLDAHKANKTKPGKEIEEENAGTEMPDKERQPTRAEDLSSIHNTHEVGTSGGDQRAKDDKPLQDTPEDPAYIGNLGAEEVPPPPLHKEDENS